MYGRADLKGGGIVVCFFLLYRQLVFSYSSLIPNDWLDVKKKQ